MAGIVDLYREHKDLLSIYFKSEQEAADCERRAEMGDDRAMRVMSLAYDAKEQKSVYVHWQNYLGTLGPQVTIFRDELKFFALNESSRNKWNKTAKTARNLDATGFSESVSYGLRSSITILPEWQPVLISKDRYLLRDYTYNPEAKRDRSNGRDSYHYKSDEMPPLEYRLFPAGVMRFELATVEKTTLLDTHLSSGSTFHILYQKPTAWRTDERIPVRLWEPSQGLNYSEDNLRALITCAYAGDLNAARTISAIYEQKIFYEYATKVRLLGKTDYAINRSHDSTKAKEWERIAEHLEGKTTPIESEKFLQEFLYSQDKTPGGLYNIGYALYHNEHIGNKARGLDYLKHAANLGDANAARELGEIYQTEFDQRGAEHLLGLAHFWYKVAAATPMTIQQEDGTVEKLDGHPNAKARVSYLEKAYPQLAAQQLDEKQLRNPSPAHIKQYTASMWEAEIPLTDVSNLIRNPSNGGITQRMEQAVEAIDDHVKEFETLTSGLQAKIEELVVRQAVLDGRIEGLKDEELAGLSQNDKLSREQLTHQRIAQASKDRWVKETIMSLGSTIPTGLIADPTGATLIPQLARNVTRAAGFGGAVNNEEEYRKMLIEELESQKIDTSRCKPQIDALANAVQELADSGPMKRLRKDETQSRAIIEGYLRQKILKSGLENCRSLDHYATQNGLASVDALLDLFEKDDARLHTALSNLCYGHANSNDMAIILEDANGLKGHDLPPHQQALKQFVERIVKGNIAHYMTRASQIDVIDDLKLVDFDTMNVDTTRTSADLMHGVRDLTAEQQGARQVDAATKLALTSMFSKQFGVTHIGQYDVTRLFSFYLHRHGRNELIAAELHDGQVSDTLASKQVSLRTPKEMRGYVERAKESARRGRLDQPDVGDMFLRVCGYEYYLPQAVITSGRGNRFKENPEAPVAYPMVNRVAQAFIEKLSLTDMATYRTQIGEELDAVIAQTFIDFFHELGREHAEKFAAERDHLRDAHAHDNYGPRFDTYEDKITADTMAKFPQFMAIYERNLRKELSVAPDDVAQLIQQQIDGLSEAAKTHLAPEIPQSGSFQAREQARTLDHRGSNMTEPWRFAG